jgi:hypothetical protein
MWRTLMAAAIVYVYGHPSLNHFRPAFLDKPLQSFHAEVNLAAQDGRRSLSSLGDVRVMRYLSDYVALLSSKLHSSK